MKGEIMLRMTCLKIFRRNAVSLLQRTRLPRLVLSMLQPLPWPC